VSTDARDRAAAARAPLIRVALHPHDADHPDLRLAIQQTLAALLEQSAPATKSAWAARLLEAERSSAPRTTPATPFVVPGTAA
jgi:hypothetical protein